MPLSEHEQRMLDQIESALYAEDPKFASSVRGGTLRAPSARRRFQGLAMFVVGLALRVSGVMIKEAGKTWREDHSDAIADTVRIQTYVEDLVAIAEHVRARLGKRKLVLMAHSWGTIPAMHAAQARPDRLRDVGHRDPLLLLIGPRKGPLRERRYSDGGYASTPCLSRDCDKSG